MQTGTQGRVSRLTFLSRAKSILLGSAGLIVCLSPVTVFAKENALPTSEEEQVVSLVLKSEINANGWTKKDLVCFSVGGRYPSSTFLKALRKEGLNVCSPAEWPKKFNCGFEVRLQYAASDSQEIVRLRAVAIDLREINAGTSDLATTVRDGAYLLRKSAEEWAIADYTPERDARNKP